MIASLLVFTVWLVLYDKALLDAFDLVNGIGFGIFVVNYCLTALLIRVYFFPKHVRTLWTFVIAAFLLFFFTAGSMLFFFLLNEMSTIDGYAESIWAILNPFASFINNPLSSMTFVFPQTIAAFVWGVLLIPFTLRWFLSRAVRFSPKRMPEDLTFEQARDFLEQLENPGK